MLSFGDHTMELSPRNGVVTLGTEYYQEPNSLEIKLYSHLMYEDFLRKYSKRLQVTIEGIVDNPTSIQTSTASYFAFHSCILCCIEAYVA